MMMQRAVFIGGASTPRKALRSPIETLRQNYSEVFGVTLADYYGRRRPEVLRLIEGADLYNHSAAAAVAEDPTIKPERMALLNPPIGFRVVRCIRYALATHRSRKRGEFGELGGCIQELATHPFRYAFNAPEMLGVDGISVAAEANKRGFRTQVVCAEEDLYFAPDESDLTRANSLGVRVTILPGGHSAPNRDPQFLRQAVELLRES